MGRQFGWLKRLVKNTDSFKTYKKGGPGSINDNIVRAIYQPSPEKLYVGTEQGLNVLDGLRYFQTIKKPQKRYKVFDCSPFQLAIYLIEIT